MVIMNCFRSPENCGIGPTPRDRHHERQLFMRMHTDGRAAIGGEVSVKEGPSVLDAGVAQVRYAPSLKAKTKVSLTVAKALVSGAIMTVAVLGGAVLVAAGAIGLMFTNQKDLVKGAGAKNIITSTEH
jgi:hypothetical protein